MKNLFVKHHDGSEGPQNMLMINSEKECVLFYGHGTDELGGFRWRRDYDHRPSMDEVKKDIEALIDELTHEDILTGFEWEGKPVWLSTENQLNFRSAVTAPVRFKLGEDADGTPVYHEFTSQSKLNAFCKAVGNFVVEKLNAGWVLKDSIDYSVYE